MNNYNRIYSVNDNFFDEMSELQYWFIGLLASDGFVEKVNQIGISQSGDDGYKLLCYIKEILCCDSPISILKTYRKPAYRLIFSSPKIRNVIAKYNIIPNKTKVFDMPNIPDKYFNAFICGYIEGDGSITISKNKNGCHYLSVSFVGNKDFILKCQEMIPIKGSVRKHSLSDIYEIRWYGKTAIKFCDWLYQYNLYQSYKYYNYYQAKKMSDDSKRVQFKHIKEQVYQDYVAGNIVNIVQYAKQINIDPKNIYRWRNEWIKNEVFV